MLSDRCCLHGCLAAGWSSEHSRQRPCPEDLSYQVCPDPAQVSTSAQKFLPTPARLCHTAPACCVTVPPTCAAPLLPCACRPPPPPQVARARQDALHGRLGEAESLLRGAAEREAAGGYFEPPRVHQPPRQCLGWVQLSAGKVAEAAQVGGLGCVGAGLWRLELGLLGEKAGTWGRSVTGGGHVPGPQSYCECADIACRRCRADAASRPCGD